MKHIQLILKISIVALFLFVTTFSNTHALSRAVCSVTIKDKQIKETGVSFKINYEYEEDTGCMETADHTTEYKIEYGAINNSASESDPLRDATVIPNKKLGDSITINNLQSGTRYAFQLYEYTTYSTDEVIKRLVASFSNNTPELPFAFTRTLRMGMRGQDVRALQEKLPAYYTGKIDGIFGRGMFAAVKKFQADRGLAVDGVFGRKSFDHMTTYGVYLPI